MKASWKDSEWNGLPVRRGELYTSVSSLARELCLTDCQTKYQLHVLQNDKRITIQTSNRFSKITICNYDSYQFSQKTDCLTDCLTEQQTDCLTDCLTDSQPSVHIRINKINKETDKEIKKEDNNNASNATSDTDFLYSLYPASTTRPDGNKVSLRSSKDKERLVRVLGHHTKEELEYTIKRYLSETNPAYYKMFQTFLNNLPDYADANQGELELNTEEDTNWLNGRKPQE